MQSAVKKLEKSQIEITVELSAVEIQPYLLKAAEKLSQEIKIEGFRPGKAPYEIIKAKLGEMAILEKTLADIINKTYQQILKEKEIITIGQPKIEVEKLAPNNPLVYKATVAILPKVKIGDYKKIRLKRQKIEVKDEQVNRALADIQKMRAKETLAARPAQKGDRLEIDFEIFLDKAPIEHGRQVKYPLTIGENRFIPGFEDQLMGIRAGETKEFELKFPDDYYQKSLAGKTSEYRVKANSVFAVELPKLDDEFAKNISNQQFKTIGELKDNIKKNLAEEEKNKQEQKLEIEMLDKIVEASEFEAIPEILIANEARKIMRELEDDITRQDFKFDDYLKSLKKTKEELEKDFLPQAEKRAKTSIIAREIYQKQQFVVSEDEVKKEIEEIIKSYPANLEAKKQLETEAYQEYLRNVIGNRKVIEYLKGIIII